MPPVSGIAAKPGKEHRMTKSFRLGTTHGAFERMMMEVPTGPWWMEPQITPLNNKRQYTYQKVCK